MSFVEDLKTYLLRLRASPLAPVRPEQIALDPTWVRAVIIQAFERLEREGTSRLQQEDLRQKFNEWIAVTTGTTVSPGLKYADSVSESLQSSFLRGGTRQEVEQYVQFAVEMKLGLDVPIPSLTRRFELERISADAWPDDWRDLFTPDKWESLSDYALEIRAVRRVGHGLAVTSIGSVLTSLSGRDAVQWLLNVEIAQSTGETDDWRISKVTVNELLSNPVTIKYVLDDAVPDYPYSRESLRRLKTMGLLVFPERDELDGYELTELGRTVLQALASPTGTPFSVLATTLSQDEALAALSMSIDKSLPEASLHGSAQAAARQARLVAHEIHNALLPAQVALNSLYESLVGGTVEAEIARFRPRIDPGITRVFKFVNDLLKTSELATRPPEAFNLVSAAQDARSSLVSTLDIQVSSPTELPPVLGYRERFVLAIVNLLRNAEQARARHVLLELKLDEGGQDILVTVDDDGPGVPEEHRERIFQRGVSLRPGGMGEGLALVKDVVEFELRGKIACVEKPGGGARFRMRVPLAERSAR